MSKKKKIIDTSHFNPGDKCFVFKKNGDKLEKYFSFTNKNGLSYFANTEKDAKAKSSNLSYMFSGIPQVWSRFELIVHSSNASIIEYEPLDTNIISS